MSVLQRVGPDSVRSHRRRAAVRVTLASAALLATVGFPAGAALAGAPSGTSTASAAATVPGTPTIDGATGGDGQATVDFSPPASDGDSTITGYTVDATDLTTTSDGGQSVSGASSPLTVTGLTDGNTYVFDVTAVNGVGTGPASAESAVVVPSGPSPTGFTWPEFHNTPGLTGTSSDPTISTTDAAGLGVRWMAPIGSALDSPVVATNQTLGQVLAYAGDADGSFEAVNASTGALVWSDFFGSGITSSPLVDNGSVWMAPQNGNRAYKLNAATGAIQCTVATIGSVVSTPVGATPPGGVPTVYISATSTGDANGAVGAYNESNCAQEWAWSGFVTPGSNSNWSPLSYGVDAAGTGLLVFGSDNPDSEVYALDASTGTMVWHYATYCPPTEDWDVGVGPNISPPGANGFADGVAYVEGKDGILYALDLTTGALVWSYNFGGNGPGNPVVTQADALSSPALSGTTLVFGDAFAVYAVNAVTGQKLWVIGKTGVVDSSPAIVGPAGAQVVAFGSENGTFQVASLATGKVLYKYQTGNFIASSPADVNGTLMVASYDGFLYDFGVGGANSPAPTTTILGPTAGQVLANPVGDVTISGTATVPDGVGAVTVQVQEWGSDGLWFHSASGSFAPGLGTASATLATPGAVTTAWSLSLPVPPQGEQYQAVASAVGRNGVADLTGFASAANAASVTFEVESAPSAPVVTGLPARVAPGGAMTIGSTGFAPDEMVKFTAPSSAGSPENLATVKANAAGATAPRRVVVPGNSSFGTDVITATGTTSGRIGTGAVYVANDDDQFGYGPLHQGDEPDDTVIARYRGVKEKLAPGWTAPVQAAADTTPAVSQGVLYFGDLSGAFHAVEETTGQTVFTLDEGSPIESSPAVDSGSVIFGDDAGDVQSVGAATGALHWSTAVGGDVGTPTVAGGYVYVGNSDGELTALNESTGSIAWTDSIGGSVIAAPAVDTTAAEVVVTSTDAVVEAVSISDGSVLWTHTINGPATGAMVDGGTVYVGSGTRSVFALGESDGSVQWTKAVSGAVVAPPILAFGNVVVGDSTGTLTYFDPTSGVVTSTQTQFGHPITGLAVAGSDILMTSSSGDAGIIQTSTYLLMDWSFTSPDGYASAGVLLNGDVFLLGRDGMLRSFTTPGRAVA